MNSRIFALVVVLSAGTVLGQVIVDDDMANDFNWTFALDDDTGMNFGYDYANDDIPAAPNGNDTIGLYALVNILDPEVAASATVTYEDAALTGQYTITVDVWNNWHLDIGSNPGFSGTTEFTGVSIGHDGLTPGLNGASFVYDGDGDSASDYRFYKGTIFQTIESGQYAVSSLNHIADDYTVAFPGFDVDDVVPGQNLEGTLRDGAAGFQWVTLKIEVDTEAIGVGVTDDPGLATVRMIADRTDTEILMGTIDNSNGINDPVNMEGSVGLTMADIFSSVSPSLIHSFGLFDNFRIVRGIGDIEPTADVDFDDDGNVDTADIDGLVAAIIDGGNDASFDLNGDLAVDAVDLDAWLTEAATVNGFAEPYLKGDANLSGMVDSEDLNAVGINWQQDVTAWSNGDFTADGIVNSSDLNEVGVNWQQGISPAASVVPEPSSSTLVLMMLMIGALVRRRR